MARRSRLERGRPRDGPIAHWDGRRRVPLVVAQDGPQRFLKTPPVFGLFLPALPPPMRLLDLCLSGPKNAENLPSGPAFEFRLRRKQCLKKRPGGSAWESNPPAASGRCRPPVLKTGEAT